MSIRQELTETRTRLAQVAAARDMACDVCEKLISELEATRAVRDALVDALMYQEPWDGEYFLTRVRGLTSRWYGTRDESLAALMAHVIREALDGVTPKKGE